MNLPRKRERALISLCGLFALLAFTSCAQNRSAAPVNAPAETVVSSTPPYKTKEPDRYRATRTITTVTSSGAKLVTKTSTARNGEMRRSESTVGSTKLVYLDVPMGRFVLLVDEKIYADLSGDVEPGLTPDDEVSPEGLLHAEDTNTSYQKLGTESVAGRNANKYRVVVNNSKGGSVSLSETLIWVDEALGMPVRSETKSADGTMVTMELSEISLDVDGRMFQVPEGYSKVTATELRKRVIATSAPNSSIGHRNKGAF